MKLLINDYLDLLKERLLRNTYKMDKNGFHYVLDKTGKVIQVQCHLDLPVDIQTSEIYVLLGKDREEYFFTHSLN